MNRAFAESPDAVFKQIAAGKRHPCAHRVVDGNGLITVTFVHIFKNADRVCSRCNGIMPLTFWQYQDKPAAEYLPA